MVDGNRHGGATETTGTNWSLAPQDGAERMAPSADLLDANGDDLTGCDVICRGTALPCPYSVHIRRYNRCYTVNW